jgi:hypothetical protein
MVPSGLGRISWRDWVFIRLQGSTGGFKENCDRCKALIIVCVYQDLNEYLPCLRATYVEGETLKRVDSYTPNT